MTIEETVKKLNHALNCMDFNPENFNILLGSLIEKENIKLKLYDFEYYNEERRAVANREKHKGISSQNFELAAEWRDLEREILRYIELRKEFNANRSEFSYDGEFLIYLYFGKERNDEKIKEIIREKAISRKKTY